MKYLLFKVCEPHEFTDWKPRSDHSDTTKTWIWGIFSFRWHK